MSPTTAVRLVAAREIQVRLRDRAFLISTAFSLFITIAVVVLPGVLAGGPSSVAVADPAAVAPLRAAGLSVRAVADAPAAERLVRDGTVDAAVVAGPRVLALDEAPDDVVGALSTQPPVQLLDPDAVDPALGFLAPFAFALIFFLTSTAFGVQIAQSVTEEKQTRIVEILVAAVPVRALLAGKVLAGTVLALAQVALVALIATAGVRLAGSDPGLAGLLGPAIGWFVPFFLAGFLLLAALWAAAGALVSRMEDLGSATLPVQMLVMLPFFAVVFLSDDAATLRVLSYVPFSAPSAMPARLFAGDAAGWEPLVSLAVLVASAALLLAAGARVYEGSLLRTNGRTSLATAWRRREPVRGSAG